MTREMSEQKAKKKAGTGRHSLDDYTDVVTELEW